MTRLMLLLPIALAACAPAADQRQADEAAAGTSVAVSNRTGTEPAPGGTPPPR